MVAAGAHGGGLAPDELAVEEHSNPHDSRPLTQPAEHVFDGEAGGALRTGALGVRGVFGQVELAPHLEAVRTLGAGMLVRPQRRLSLLELEQGVGLADQRRAAQAWRLVGNTLLT
jgi:hypothetical protein